MAKSPTPGWANTTTGLTLIEVLIALVIVAVAMTAIIKAATENIRATAYLQNKTIAMWVGQQVLNEARTGILVLPPRDEEVTKTSNMLGKKWYWQASQSTTANKSIKRIQVKVFDAEPIDEDVTPLIRLESYVYLQQDERMQQ